ncbi:hypothetical protein [Ornithinimicrobium faecis]|uniref:Uncharacterized protein n=1 Tax=Ornithinimicrobium faecis TaxID=2934158 RepID=A0ABY4YXM1_9MICO|nr:MULTISPECIES: hypothetical protein [unclassified Ornithinimicrobium]USQ81533.1 hypothetical protein NF556_07760 [Ornithinimicrobium sp. HY1793]
MGRDELRRALNEASDGPERDFTGTWAQGRKVRRRRQTAQGLGVVAVAAAAVGAFTLGGGNLLGEDATVEPLPPAEQTLATEEATDEQTAEDAEEATTEQVTEEATTEDATTEGEVADIELPGPNDPLPTNVEDYVRVYLAAGMAGDDALLERMGTDGAVEASVTWTNLSLLLDDVRVSEGVEEGTDIAWVLAEGPFGVSVTVDHAAALAGADDAVLHGESGDAPARLTVEQYADLGVESWVGGWAGIQAAPDAETVLDQVPIDGDWVRSGSSADGEVVLVTYVNDTVEGELVLTVDPALVELREYQAIVDASFSGDPIGVPTTHPCDEPWSRVPPAGTGDAPGGVDLTSLDLFDLAASCNVDGLAAWAERDSTMLSFGALTPADAFAGEQGRERANVMARMFAEYQPALENGDDGQTVAVWPGLPLDRLDELVELGLYSQEEIDTMQDNGAYTGWRIVIGEDGSWLSMTEGD